MEIAYSDGYSNKLLKAKWSFLITDFNPSRNWSMDFFIYTLNIS